MAVGLFKKIVLLSVGFFVLMFFGRAVLAQTAVKFDFFFSPTCQYCRAEEKFLDQLAVKFPETVISRYDISDKKNTARLAALYDAYDVPQDQRGRTPANFIDGGAKGKKYFIGYSETVDPLVENYLLYLTAGENDQIGGGDSPTDSDGAIEAPEDADASRPVSLPFIGQIKLKNLSPAALTVTVGILDGFNACAMVALFFLLTTLIGAGNRRRVFLIGGVFILVSGLVYFLFIAAWLNLFMFLSYFKIISLVVAIVIIVFSLFLLEDYFYGVVCKLCDIKADGQEKIATVWQRKLLAAMTRFSTLEKSLIVTIVGVALVAAGINTIELFCSFGFPLAYTKILADHQLSAWSYYGYLSLYILFYMLDDLLIFLAAVLTMRAVKTGDRYLKLIKLVSGAVLLILGLLMVFRPEILT